MSVLEELHKAGAHFLRVSEKRPTDRGWQDNPLSLKDTLAAKELGLKPGSLGLLILDLDIKNLPESEIDEECKRRIKTTTDLVGKPIGKYSTPSGAAHLIYRKPDKTVDDTSWKYGETRADSGQVVLYDSKTILSAVKRLSKSKPIDLSKIPPSKSKTTKLVTIEDHIERLRNAKDNDASRHDAWRDSAKQLQEEGKLTGKNVKQFKVVWREAVETTARDKEFDDLVSSARKKYKSKVPIVKCTGADQMTMKRIRWLWDGWIPLQSISLLAGVEGLGKSTYTLHLASRLTRGQLAGEYFGNPVNVSLYMTEDDQIAVTLPRLAAAGADLKRVKFFEGIVRGDTTDPMFIEKDIKSLENHIEEHDIKLLILDPIVTRIGGARNDNNYTDVRTVLETLGKLFHDHRASCLGVTHFNKSSGPIENRVMGSRAWRAVIRSLLCIYRDEDNEHERIVTHSKCNYGPRRKSLRFGFENEIVGKDEEDGTDIIASQIKELGESELTDRDAMSAMDNNLLNKIEKPVDRARKWIVDYLEANTDKQLTLDGKPKVESVSSDEVIAAAIKAGHSKSTVCRAASDCVEKIADGRSTRWKLIDVRL